MEIITPSAGAVVALEPVVSLGRGMPVPRTTARAMSLLEANCSAPHALAVAGGTAAVFSCPSPGKETPNEDAAMVVELTPQHAVLVVADGLGGHASGEHASRLAIQSLRQALLPLEIDPQDTNADALRWAILAGIEEANRAVLELGTGAATTLAVVEVQGPTVRPYHVGDSEILITGQRGRVKLQTICHSPIGYAVEAGLIAADDAIHHEERHVISNVIGSATMRIELGPAVTLAARDTVLIASDGLFDNLLQQEIVDGIRTGPLHEALSGIVTEARRRMIEPREGLPSKPDDLTVVAYRRK
ncbi:MAG: protein phosphatase 2C domain-containing protein [Pirellulales bacterium]